MAINSKNDICNLSLQHLGNYGSINDIDLPKTDKEKVYSLWYDNERQTLLKTMMPNFALKRDVLAEAVVTIKFGYKHAYPIPADCLKVLGIGDIDKKLDNRVSIEGGYIYTDEEYEDGLEVRYIADIQDVTKMTPEFKATLAITLAAATALPITQDLNKKQLMIQMIPQALANLTAVNAQENLPIRRSESRFRAARWSDPAMNRSKK